MGSLDEYPSRRNELVELIDRPCVHSIQLKGVSDIIHPPAFDQLSKNAAGQPGARPRGVDPFETTFEQIWSYCDRYDVDEMHFTVGCVHQIWREIGHGLDPPAIAGAHGLKLNLEAVESLLDAIKFGPELRDLFWLG